MRQQHFLILQYSLQGQQSLWNSLLFIFITGNHFMMRALKWTHFMKTFLIEILLRGLGVGEL